MIRSYFVGASTASSLSFCARGDATTMATESCLVAGLPSPSSSSGPGTNEGREMDERIAVAVEAEVDEQHYDECPMCYEFLLPHQRKFHWGCDCRLPFHALCVIEWVEQKQEHQRCPTCNAPHTAGVRQRLSQCCDDEHQRALRVQPVIVERPLPRSRSRSRSRSILRARRRAFTSVLCR